jgi:membrane-associated phospholipid phosphatase
MNKTLRGLAIIAMAGLAHTAWAQAPGEPSAARAAAEPMFSAERPTPMAEPTPAAEQPAPPHDTASHPDLKRVIGDVEDYYTSPLRWDDEQWALFGGALGAIAVAHHYDRNVRAHFVEGTGLGGSTSDLQDALPAAALLVGTYLYSSEHEDRSGLTVSWAMAEAAGLSTVTAYALKFAAGRERPDETTDPNRWLKSGSSFPSVHVAAAFAIGTVFAESGSGGYRWVTRVLGYGVAGFTAYQRLKHNAHWLSDAVAGAALGASTAVFVLDRTYGGEPSKSALSVVPMNGGLMLAYRTTLP